MSRRRGATFGLLFVSSLEISTTNVAQNCIFVIFKKVYFIKFKLFSSPEGTNLSLQDVLLGIIAVQCPLLNYFLLIAKLYIWDCRRSQTRPIIAGFKLRINIKFETEKYICTKNRTLSDFYKKWAILCTA